MCEIVRSEAVKIFVATWNVGGRAPHSQLNLEDLLKVEGPSDIYVLGFQEIVPLNAGNVLVVEDNEPAAQWLSLIARALNFPASSSNSSALSDLKPPSTGHLFFKRPSLKLLSRSYRANGARLKACNCSSSELGELISMADRGEGWHYHDDECNDNDDARDHDDDDDTPGVLPEPPGRRQEMAYNLIFSKKMVGIFLSVWVRRELVSHIGHLRSATVGRGIMGCLGNKLVMEMEAGRVFRGWTEGKIEFAPTYKYTHNSDCYAGETVRSKKKRRTPAWCDRIVWHGEGIEQLTYIRGESRFSDHRPVCGVFLVEVPKVNTISFQRRRDVPLFSASLERERKMY